MSAGELKAGDFESLEGPIEVVVQGLPEPLALAVESVTPLPPHRYREAPFSVVLSGPGTPALVQGTFTVRHPKLGDLELFLVPITRDASRTRYELTFN